MHKPIDPLSGSKVVRLSGPVVWEGAQKGVEENESGCESEKHMYDICRCHLLDHKCFAGQGFSAE